MFSLYRYVRATRENCTTNRIYFIKLNAFTFLCVCLLVCLYVMYVCNVCSRKSNRITACSCFYVSSFPKSSAMFFVCFFLGFSMGFFSFCFLQRTHKISKETSILKFILQKYLQISQSTPTRWRTYKLYILLINVLDHSVGSSITYTSIHVLL